MPSFKFIYARLPLWLKNSINQADVVNDSYQHIVTRLERVLKLNGLGILVGLQLNTVNLVVFVNMPNTNAHRLKPTCDHCKKPRHYRNQCHQLNRQKEQTESNLKNSKNKNSGANNPDPRDSKNNKKNNKNSDRAERRLKTFYTPFEKCG